MDERRAAQTIDAAVPQATLFAWAEESTRVVDPVPMTLRIDLAVAPSDARDAPGVSKPERLICLEVLRLLPEKRLVFRAELDGVEVVVKLFIGAGSERYAQRELAGSQAIREAGIATPNCLADWELAFASSDDPVIQRALVLEHIVAEPVTAELIDQGKVSWETFAEVLAKLHSKGYVHRDFHLGNLLYQADQTEASGRLWLIDGDGVRRSRFAATRRSSIGQFSQLCAQSQMPLPEVTIGAAWWAYCRQRGWPEQTRDPHQVPEHIVRGVAQARRRRIVHFQAKTRRQCSAVLSCRMGSMRLLINRDWWRETTVRPNATQPAAFLDWLRELPQQFSDWPVIKAGNTATLATTNWNGRCLVVKRYNNKSPWHRARRLIRHDRGLNSWVFGHTLRFCGLQTAVPIALCRSPFAGPTYLVMSAVQGEELSAQACERDGALYGHCADLLRALSVEGLVHGDLKASNIMIASAPVGEQAIETRPAYSGSLSPSISTQRLQFSPAYLLDLDAMCMPRWSHRRQTGGMKDRRRFLRNFAGAPSTQQRFRSILGL